MLDTKYSSDDVAPLRFDSQSLAPILFAGDQVSIIADCFGRVPLVPKGPPSLFSGIGFNTR